MIFRPLIAAALIFAATACVSAPTNNTALQDTVSLMVTFTQHDEGLNLAEASASLDEAVAAAPNDPYVLKVAAGTRVNLSNAAQDRAMRVKLRHNALAEYDRAIANAKPNAPPRAVMMNGQATEIDLNDLADLRAALFQTNQTDR